MSENSTDMLYIEDICSVAYLFTMSQTSVTARVRGKDVICSGIGEKF